MRAKLCLEIRHVGGSEKIDLGSDPMDLDAGSFGIIDPSMSFCDRSTGIVDLDMIFVERSTEITYWQTN